jgi:hypothetical protein
MPRCQAIKQDGRQCTFIDVAHDQPNNPHPQHLRLCGVHRATYFRNVQAVGGIQHAVFHCFNVVRRNGRLQWCPNDAFPGLTLCDQCNNRVVRRVQVANAHRDENIIARELAIQIAEAPNPPTWQHATQMIYELQELHLSVRGRKLAAHTYYQTDTARNLELPQWRHMPEWRFLRFWRWLRAGMHGEPILNVAPHDPRPAEAPAPAVVRPQATELGRIARDSQNVHTAAVTNQTNSAEQKLLSTIIPEDQQTELTITREWLSAPSLSIRFATYLKVINDMNHWFRMRSCRRDNDQLYHNLLRGLVAMLNRQETETKKELYKRLWEECQDSVGMCCEGHISRLCNVLVGFDESFQSHLSLGEILQNKMAAIAGLDVSTEMKHTHANAIFDELGVPQEQRTAWLEAF